ncbi:MAG: Fic family protein [Planctomycetes bacterium]|nr:Fic family protein [Planctomycetota bacterium]
MSKTRTYERTHPWITFQLDLERASWTLWTMLGECQSKCEHIARVPLKPGAASELYRIFLGKGALASAAIEGNSLTEDQVQELLEGTLELPPSQSYLETEVQNIISGCNYISDLVFKQGQEDLSPELIHKFNEIVLKDLELPEDVIAGEFPPFGMGIGRYKAAPQEDRGYLLERLCDWINKDWRPEEARSSKREVGIIFGILKAIVAHIYFEWIHPFGDGNGRTGRLIEFFILVAAGAPLPAGHLLSNHYNLTRTEYYRRFDQSSKTNDGVISFLRYAVGGLLDGLQTQLNLIRTEQLDVAWRNYVYEFFRDRTQSDVARRQQRLVLDLSLQSEAIPRSKLATFSAKVQELYSRTTDKTLLRDIKKLKENKLILEVEGGFIANKERILAFLPPRRNPKTDDTK